MEIASSIDSRARSVLPCASSTSATRHNARAIAESCRSWRARANALSARTRSWLASPRTYRTNQSRARFRQAAAQIAFRYLSVLQEQHEPIPEFRFARCLGSREITLRTPQQPHLGARLICGTGDPQCPERHYHERSPLGFWQIMLATG